jgi:oligoribonuclease (3'-5' exoribonuclease)
MKSHYLSVDIETSSLNPSQGQVLELAVIIDDLAVKVNKADLEDYIEQLPKFHCYIKHTNVVGEHYAVSMHNRIWQILAKEKPIESLLTEDLLSKGSVVYENNVYIYLAKFLTHHNVITKENNTVVVAGKNVAGFDIPWLKTLHGFADMDSDSLFKFAHRTIDPAMLYMKPTDKRPPSLDKCLQRAGFNKSVSHCALDDSTDVIRCLKMSSLYND